MSDGDHEHAPAPSPAEPDHELLTLCRQFHEQNAAVEAAAAAEAPDDDGLSTAMGARWGTSDQIEGICPQTEAGRRAKAAIGLALLSENRKGCGHIDADARFALATLRDIAEPTPVEHASDAELLAACGTALAVDTETDSICDAVDGLPSSDPRWIAAYEQTTLMMTEKYHPAVERAASLPARTHEGLRAKASLVLSYLRSDSNSAEIALSLARDVLGRA